MSVHVCVISVYGGEGGGIHFLIFAVLGWGCLFIIIWTLFPHDNMWLFFHRELRKKCMDISVCLSLSLSMII